MAAQTLAQTVRRGGEPQLTSAASEALAVLGAKAVPALSGLQSDANPIIRARVMEIAAAMSDPTAAVPLYVAAMKDGYAPIRDSALSHLRFANVTDPAAVSAAAEALRDPNADVRQTALEYLTNLGENAAPASQKLAASLDSRAIRILANIGSRAEPAVPALLAFYQDPSRAKEDRVDAVIAVSRILGRASPTTQPAK
jgi:HEAT repeat protein